MGKAERPFRSLVSQVQSGENCAIFNHGHFHLFTALSALKFGGILYEMEPVSEEPALSYEYKFKRLQAYIIGVLLSDEWR